MALINIDENKCSGCGWCIEACEFGAITYHAFKKAVVSCDLCDGQPVCVEFCQRKALALVRPEELGSRARKSIVKARYP